MKKLIFIILLFSVYSFSQNKIIRSNDLTDSLNAIRASIALIEVGGFDTVHVYQAISSKLDKSAFADSFNNRFSATSIAAIKEVAEYEPVIADSSILLYSGGVWSIFDLSEALSATANNAITITYPDANTISFNDTDILLLDPLTLEINGSNQLTVIGGVGGSGGLFETDGNGDLMPNDAEVTDTYYELDGNGDIQPL